MLGWNNESIIENDPVANNQKQQAQSLYLHSTAAEIQIQMEDSRLSLILNKTYDPFQFPVNGLENPKMQKY